MTKLLIATRPDDTHAVYVKLALNKIGYIADLWYPADFPSLATYTFSMANNTFNWNKEYADYDTIWCRRPSKPHLPTHLHPEDAIPAKKENNFFMQNVWQAIFPHARWINPVNASMRANSKLLQLRLADDAKLNIPDTLMSNNPIAIKNFVRKNDAIYKTFYPLAWVNKNELKLTYANSISLADLPSDNLLQCMPGIFQKKISKQYELRVTYFGQQYIAVKIDSQQHAEARSDWRQAPTHELQLEQVNLPAAIDQACQALMKQLGIIFGCFDFIVTPDDKYYFLEVNEQGQFLWIEEVNPDIKMLQAFVKFVSDTPSSVSMAEFDDEAKHFIAHAVKNHVNPLLYGG